MSSKKKKKNLVLPIEKFQGFFVQARKYDNVTTPNYPFFLYYLSSGRLQEAKNKRNFQTSTIPAKRSLNNYQYYKILCFFQQKEKNHLIIKIESGGGEHLLCVPTLLSGIVALKAVAVAYERWLLTTQEVPNIMI